MPVIIIIIPWYLYSIAMSCARSWCVCRIVYLNVFVYEICSNMNLLPSMAVQCTVYGVRCTTYQCNILTGCTMCPNMSFTHPLNRTLYSQRFGQRWATWCTQAKTTKSTNNNNNNLYLYHMHTYTYTHANAEAKAQSQEGTGRQAYTYRQ